MATTWPVTDLATGGDTTGGSSQGISVSGVAQNGDPITVWIGSTRGAAGVPAVTGISGLGLSWTLVKASDEFGVSNFIKGELWVGVGVANATSGTITVTFASSNTNGNAWSAQQHSGLDRLSPFKSGNTAKNGSSSNATSGSATLGTTPTDGVYACLDHLENEDFTAGTNYVRTTGAGVFGGYLTPANSVGVEQQTALNTVAGFSWTTNKIWLVVAVEVQLAIHPATVVATAATPAVTAKGDATASPQSLLQAIADVPAPTIIAVQAGNATATPSAIDARAGVPDPTVVVGAAATATPATVAARSFVLRPTIHAAHPATSGDYGNGYLGGYGPVAPPVPAPRRIATTPQLSFQVDLVHDTGVAITFDPIWTELGPGGLNLVRAGDGFSIKRGRQRVLDRNEAGTVEVRADNRDGLFNPDQAVGDIVMRRFRLSALTDRTTTPYVQGQSVNGGPDTQGGGPGIDRTPLADGLVDSVEYEYPDQGRDATVMIRGVDGLGILQRLSPFDGGIDVEEIAADRLALALSQAKVAGEQRFDTKGSHPLQGQVWSQTDISGVLDEIAASDGGNFYASRDGAWVYRSPQVDADPIDEKLLFAVDAHRYSDVTLVIDEALIFNSATLTTADDAQSFALLTTGPLEDAVSIARYWKRELPDRLSASLLADSSDMQRRANELLANYALPKLIVTRLDLSNKSDPWRLVLERDLWDKVLVRVPLPDGSTLSQASRIEGIEIRSPERRDWRVGWWLSPVPWPELLTDEQAEFETGITGWVAESNCAIARTSATVWTYTILINHRSGPPSLVTITVSYTPPYVPHAGGADSMSLMPLARGDMKVKTLPIPVEGHRLYRALGQAGVAGQNLDADTDQGANPMPAHLEVDWLDSSSNVLSTSVAPSISSVPSLGGFFGDNSPGRGFTRLVKLPKLDARAPDNASFAVLRVVCEDANASPHFVDSFSFRRTG